MNEIMRKKLREIKNKLSERMMKIEEMDSTEQTDLLLELDAITGIAEKWEILEKMTAQTRKERREMKRELRKKKIADWKKKMREKIDAKIEQWNATYQHWEETKYKPWKEKVGKKVNRWIGKRKIELNYLKKAYFKKKG